MRKFINDLKKDLADFKEINKWGKFKIKHMWHPWALKVLYPSTLVLLFLIILMMDSCDSGSSKKIELTQLEKSILHLPTGTIKVSSLSQTDHKNLCLSANNIRSGTGKFLDKYINMSQAGLSTARQIMDNGGSFTGGYVAWTTENECEAGFNAEGILNILQILKFLNFKRGKPFINHF